MMAFALEPQRNSRTGEKWSGRRHLNPRPLVRVQKSRGDRTFNGVCRLMSHELGWELRLEIDGDLQRSAVCRSQDEILDTMEQWKAAMMAKGWT